MTGSDILQCGLVGENLAHSYSKLIHSKLGNYEYELCSVCPEELENLIRSKNFIGLNVTMPYKKAVMKYCNELDSTAKKTGSVNTLAFENGALKGYNTDYFGLSYALKRSGVSLKNKKVIVLGNGGVSATVQALARDLGAKEILVCSSRSSFNYKNVYDRPDAEVIINATPVGMYPRSEEKLIDLTKFKNLSGFADLIYNPFYTRLMLDAKKMKVPVCGGLAMLVAQAKASSEIFMKAKLDDSLIEKIINEIKSNITSATSIRKNIDNVSLIKAVMPNDIIKYIKKIDYDKYFYLIKYQILSSDNLTNYLGVTEGLENKLKKEVNTSSNLNELILNIKSKRYSYNRISRLLNHIVCKTKNDENISNIKYIRVLGLSKRGTNVLKSIKKNIDVPIITKYKKEYDHIFKTDYKANLIYSLVTDYDIKNEFRSSINKN